MPGPSSMIPWLHRYAIILTSCAGLFIVLVLILVREGREIGVDLLKWYNVVTMWLGLDDLPV